MMTTPAMGTVRDYTTGGGAGIRHLKAPGISLQGLADLATIVAGQVVPVVDMTGLKGRYQVDLAISMADFVAVLTGSHDESAAQDAVVNAVQNGLKKYGLQLQPRKTPVEFFVVDHIEKTPTPN